MAGAVRVLADGEGGFGADFEPPHYMPGSVAGQGPWWVDQGSAVVVPGAGMDGTAALSILPSEIFGQARLSLTRSAGLGAVVYFDAWLRLPPAPWLVFDETLDVEGARIGLFTSSASGVQAEWHVLHGGGMWLGTGRGPALAPGMDFTAGWTRLTIRLDHIAGSWDFKVDEELLAEGLPFEAAHGGEAAHFFILGDPFYPVLIDNVSVSSVDPLGAGGADGGESASGADPVGGTPPDTDDSDADGLPDAWETANGFNPDDPRDAASDRDGDGLTALDEYLLGSDEKVADLHRALESGSAAVFNKFSGGGRRAVLTGD